MTFKQNFELLVLGKPVEKRYMISESEEAFKDIIRSLMTTEGSLSMFSFGSKKFVGEFRDNAGREISLRPNGSAYRRDSIANVIWIHGIITPTENDKLIFDVSFYRTNFARFGQWILAVVLGLTFLFISYQALRVGDFKNFLIFGGAILGFYVMGVLISISQAAGQIKYFEQYFFRNIEGHEISGNGSD
tara:strand:+ start:1909 stop:2475 length:567 start_codon:yes stop_codon:yes gene_type:complete